MNHTATKFTHKFDHVVELGYAGVVDGVQRGLVVVGDLQLDEAGQVVRRAERRYPVEHLCDVGRGGFRSRFLAAFPAFMVSKKSSWKVREITLPTAADGVQQVGKKKIVGRTFAETFRELGDRPWDRLLNFSVEVKLKFLPLTSFAIK